MDADDGASPPPPAIESGCSLLIHEATFDDT
jgi:ribonuclease BN (tRNA processing enzyme)